MEGHLYEQYAKKLLDEKKITLKQIDDCVRDILRMKFRLGLFEHPYAQTESPVYYTQESLDIACRATGAEVREYTAAPVFMDENGKCRHQWLIEFSRKPEDLDTFAELLDKALQSVNSDYEAKRYKGITLQRLEIISARQGLFDDWLRKQGKLGGQHKVPRLNNHRKIIESILETQTE